MTRTRKNRNALSPIQWNDQLILFRYFLDLFGKTSLAELAGKMNSPEYEGVDENQNTYFWGELDLLLMRQGNNAKISRDLLREYDERICRHVKQIGERRGGLKLKYFQYLSCLFTEIYLERYFSDKENFAADLNAFVDKVKAESLGAIDIEPYTAENLNKLAFMCATGSGKTLIMHINILQFLYHLRKAKSTNSRMGINKIIVLAPNEGMSNQHLDELKMSNISAELFSKDIFSSNADVIVIDMNKLKEEGKIKTVSVDSFEQNNLVLVDEAHRGLAGDVWYEYRSRLSAEGGFAFEYSATLKQAMKSNKPNNYSQEEWKKRLNEYFRSIIMDYSYKYFYNDGYGKEYRIYNLQENINDEQRQLYLTGCLMTFYQQLKLYHEKGNEFAPFQIEKPLLIFVGNRVTAKTSEAEMTDVEEVLEFINRFVNNKYLSIKRIEAVLTGQTGLVDSAGQELFSNSFNALFSFFGVVPNAEDIFKDIMRLVFNSDSSSDEPRLHVLNLRQVQGEIALRIGADGEYFGVVSIGDTSGLIKSCENKGIVTETDEFSTESLFRKINVPNSNINILIGSRKFTEGWNSWRVSTMGLINFAKGEGSQAIQLFGRGVRLRGYGGHLKRSNMLDDNSINIPRYIEILETLTIFGIRAQYMEDFKKYLEMEDIPSNRKTHEYLLPVISRHKLDEDKKLLVIKVKDGANFKKQAKRLLLGKPDEGLLSYLNKNKVQLDCRSKVQSIESAFHMQFEYIPEEHTIDKECLPLLDYERILYELEIYKNEKCYYNISLTIEGIKEVLKTDGWYSLIVPKRHITIDSMEKLSFVTDIVIMLLKNYIDKFYKYEKNRWEAPLLEYQELDKKDKNLVKEYRLIYQDVNETDRTAETLGQFVEELKMILDQYSGIPYYEMGILNNSLTAFDFQNHLYTPLICQKRASGLNISISPVSLNEDEKRFVDKLRAYIEATPSILEGKNLYLLRNKSKVGMGFFEAANFYPDFVLWIDTPDVQYISFIDPKGLLRTQWDDPKIEFHKTIKELEERLQPTNTDKKIVLNSFIMSGTRPEDLRQWWGKGQPERRLKNVFCLDENDCIEGMMAKVLSI